MITIGPNYGKLRTSLQLAATRLKILQSKKLELIEKLKLEVANYLKSGKDLKAKLSVQKIIKEEANVEAMELMEMYCNQILERYGLFQQMKRPDISIVIPISSLIWVAPYYENHVDELKVISKQFLIKYGACAFKLALTNKTGKVNPELIERASLISPSNEKVENCLRNICYKYNIVYMEKRLANTCSNPNEQFSSNVRSSFISDSDLQFSDKEANESNESYSRKEQSAGNKLQHMIANANEQNQGIADKVCDKIFRRKSTHKSLFDDKKEGKCEATTYPQTVYSENPSAITFNSEDSSENKIWKRKTESCIHSNLLPFDDCHEKKLEAPGVSADIDSHFYADSFKVIYPDPPPPYSFQCLPENKTYDQNGRWEDYLVYQLPSCPTENPDSPSTSEEK